MIKRLNGINVAVAKEDLGEVVERWASVFGVKPVYYDPGDFAVPGVIGAKLEIGGVEINIIAGEDDEGSIARFVSNKGEGVFLISFEVDNVEETTKEISEKGVKFVSDVPLTVTGCNFPGGKANFIHPKSMNGVQIEIIKFEE